MKYNFSTIILILVLVVSVNSLAQDFKEIGFKDYYPISIRPSFSTGFGNNEYEQIIFEAKPVVYYGIYNNIQKSLSQDTIRTGDAVYMSFQPQLRLYNENSKPVKTPSYKVLVGWQPIIRTNKDNFVTLAFETGHYSNGQTGGAFSTEFDDETPQNDSIYKTFTDDTDLAALLNRKNGNFSTNLSRISVNYRINRFGLNNEPLRIHSLTASYQLYHKNLLGILDFGGFSNDDIEIYGRHEVDLSYEFTGYYKKMRYILGAEAFVHFGMHPSTKPYRLATRGILFPWNNDFGFFTQVSYGFDDYNYRFLDSFARVSFGLTWDWFTPFVVKPLKVVD